MTPGSVININEATLIAAIEASSKRLVFVAPGITEPIAVASDRPWRSYLPIYESLIHAASRGNKQNSGVLSHY